MLKTNLKTGTTDSIKCVDKFLKQQWLHIITPINTKIPLKLMNVIIIIIPDYKTVKSYIIARKFLEKTKFDRKLFFTFLLPVNIYSGTQIFLLSRLSLKST